MDDSRRQRYEAALRALERREAALAEEDWQQSLRLRAQYGESDAALARQRAHQPGDSEESTPSARARRRAAALLLENLTETQLRQYASDRTFDVIGGHSGKRYRLWHRTMQNIEELDRQGRRRCIWCFHPVGLDLCDVLLAQKTALELFEYDALRIAQRYSDFAFNSAPPDVPWR